MPDEPRSRAYDEAGSSHILAVNKIMEGVRPMKPEGAKRLGFSDELWRTVELRWLEDRNTRPGVEHQGVPLPA